jgi:hypothetical protein
MKTLLLTLSFLSLLFMPLASRAQDAAPWPPDPKAIFADGVEIVSADIITRPPMPENTRPVADEESRIVKVYDQDTGIWREYPYPDQVTVLSKTIRVRSDGSVVFNEYSGYSLPTYRPAMWILNPTTGEFSRAEVVCGTTARALPNEGEWILLFDPDSGTHLCFTETGEQSPPLPPDVGWETFSPSATLSLSPDKKWLALLGYMAGTSNTSDYSVIYSYEIATKRLNYLGKTDYGEYTFFEDWVSNTRGTLSNGPPQESLSKDYFTFDVTEPNSLKLVVRGWMYDFYDNPPRYEYVTTKAFLEWKTGSEVFGHTHCQFTLYDSAGVHDYDLGYDCSYARVIRGKDGYFYVRIDSNPSAVSTLVYLDIRTGSMTDLFTGEIEGIESVSPDGRYIAMVMDTSGQIDVVDYYPEYQDWTGIPNANLAVWDTANRQFVYQVSSLADTYWLKQAVFVINNEAGSGQIVNLGSSKPISIPFTFGSVDLSPDQQHILIGTSDNNGAEVYSVMDLSTAKARTVIYRKALSGYSMSVEWVSNGLITLILRPDLGNRSDPSRSANYTIRIPQSES